MPFAPRRRQADPARLLKCFFFADAVAVEEPPDRTNSRLLLSLIEQTALDLFQGQVGLLPNQPSNHSSRFFNGDRLWLLLDLASKLPVSRQRFVQRIAVEFPITNCLAAARAAAPPSTTWITRTRRSFEYPIAGLLSPRSPQDLIRGSL
jgi:hypothetical protein